MPAITVHGLEVRLFGEMAEDVARAVGRAREAQSAWAGASFREMETASKTATPAWRTLPSWYMVASEDRMINPDLERWMAQRIGDGARRLANRTDLEIGSKVAGSDC